MGAQLLWQGAQKHGMRRGKERVAESAAHSSHLRVLKTERFSVRLLFPMKCQDVAAAPSHFHTVVQHNGTIAAGSLFCCCALFISSTTILNLRKIKIHLWNKSFLFFSILCLKLMFVIVPVKSLQRPITSALVKEGMSPHLYKQSKAFHFSLAK